MIVNENKGRLVLNKLFEIRDQIHYIHLQTDSYAEHKALNTFYDSFLTLADTFIETYQGLYGKIGGKLMFNVETDVDSIHYLKSIRSIFTKSGLVRQSFSEEDTHLHNIVDEMLGLIDQTLYMLTLV